MAVKKHVLTPYLIAGDMTSGVWCTACGLPSAVRVPLLLLTVAGVQPVGTVTRCLDCERETYKEEGKP